MKPRTTSVQRSLVENSVKIRRLSYSNKQVCNFCEKSANNFGINPFFSRKDYGQTFKNLLVDSSSQSCETQDKKFFECDNIYIFAYVLFIWISHEQHPDTFVRNPTNSKIKKCETKTSACFSKGVIQKTISAI